MSDERWWAPGVEVYVITNTEGERHGLRLEQTHITEVVGDEVKVHGYNIGWIPVSADPDIGCQVLQVTEQLNHDLEAQGIRLPMPGTWFDRSDYIEPEGFDNAKFIEELKRERATEQEFKQDLDDYDFETHHEEGQGYDH